jgi:hypothetical protein
MLIIVWLHKICPGLDLPFIYRGHVYDQQRRGYDLNDLKTKMRGAFSVRLLYVLSYIFQAMLNVQEINGAFNFRPPRASTWVRALTFSEFKCLLICRYFKLQANFRRPSIITRPDHLIFRSTRRARATRIVRAMERVMMTVTTTRVFWLATPVPKRRENPARDLHLTQRRPSIHLVDLAARLRIPIMAS